MDIPVRKFLSLFKALIPKIDVIILTFWEARNVAGGKFSP